jgi:hypothetical protein
MGNADCHIHTDFSDGLHSPRVVVKAASRRGLSVIAVTDHDTLEGAFRARDYAETHPGLGVEVVVGEEISTVNGHVLGLFLTDYIPPRLTAQRTVQLIHQQGGLAVLAHPYNWFVGHFKGFPRAIHLADTIPFDGIETLCQGDALSFWANHRARCFAASRDFATLGSSDAHDSEFIGMACSEFEGTSAKDFRKALLFRATVPRLLRPWTPSTIWRHVKDSRVILRRFRKLSQNNQEVFA